MRYSGASGKANVGISNDKGGGMPPRRKTKDRPRVSRVLRISLMAMPMEETVNIPLLTVRVTWRRRSETAACRRNCRLKGVGYERGRQIRPSS